MKNKKISDNFVQESFLKSSLFILFYGFIIISYIFFLNLNQTQKVKQHYNPFCHTHIPSQLTRTRTSIGFFSFSVLFQRCVGIPNLHLWNVGSGPDPHRVRVGGYPFWGELRGTFGVVSWHGSEGWTGESAPFVWVFVSIVSTPSPSLEALSVCVSCPMLFSVSRILTFSNLSFPSPLLLLLFTFIRWRHSKGQIWPALSHKGEAWIPFDVGDSGPNWGQPTQR